MMQHMIGFGQFHDDNFLKFKHVTAMDDEGGVDGNHIWVGRHNRKKQSQN